MTSVPGEITTLFATPSELRTYLGETGYLSEAAPDYEATALLALELATAAVQGYTRQEIEYVEDDVVVLDGAGRPTLFLPERPVVAIDSITVDAETLAVDEHYTWTAEGFLRHVASWPTGKLATVTYT